MAFLALVFDNLPCAAALLTGDDIHHLSEGAVPDDPLLTGTVAVRAFIDLGSGFCSGTMTMIAGFILRYGEFLLHACECFPECNP